MQGQVMELNVGTQCKKLYTELWTPQAPPCPAPRMPATSINLSLPPLNQRFLPWRNWTVPEKRPPHTDIRGSLSSPKAGSLPNRPTAKLFRQQNLSSYAPRTFSWVRLKNEWPAKEPRHLRPHRERHTPKQIETNEIPLLEISSWLWKK